MRAMPTDPLQDPPATPSTPAADSAATPAREIGRAWIGPALLLAGATSLLRVEMITDLAARSRGLPPDWASWAVLGDWPAEMIGAGILSAAATLLIWGVRGLRRLLGSVLALALVTSAITGWPLDHELYGNPFDAYSPLKLGGLVLAGTLWIPLLAAASERLPGLERLLANRALLALCAAVGLGLPGARLWQQSEAAPRMQVRRVLELLGDRGVLSVAPNAPQTWVVPDLGSESIQLSWRAEVRGGSQAGLPVTFHVSADGTALQSETLLGFEQTTLASGASTCEVRAGQSLQFSVSLEDGGLTNPPDMRLRFTELRLERATTQPRTRSTHERPSLLFVTIDSLRADRLSCYGQERYTSPGMDRLAQRGVLFENAFSTSSWTWPSCASLFTGLGPYEHGLLDESDAVLDPQLRTLAESLQASGFSTSAISGSPRLNSAALFDQGFEAFDTSPVRRDGQELESIVRTRLAQLAGTRFFLYVHLTDTEAPRQPLDAERQRMGMELPESEQEREAHKPRELPLEEYTRALFAGDGLDSSGVPHPELVIPAADLGAIQEQYDASVASADRHVDVILQQLDALGLQDSTIVVLTSDHGEELLDHGYLSHGHGIGREQVHVPMILAGPGIAARLRVSAEVSNRHLAPTLARLLGSELPDVTDAVNLLQPALSSPGVFYQTSRGRWRGMQGVEMIGSRRNGFVVQSSSAQPDWGRPTAEDRALRIYFTEQDPGEWSDLSPADNYFERAREAEGQMFEEKRAQEARRHERAQGEPR